MTEPILCRRIADGKYLSTSNLYYVSLSTTTRIRTWIALRHGLTIRCITNYAIVVYNMPLVLLGDIFTPTIRGGRTQTAYLSEQPPTLVFLLPLSKHYKQSARDE